MAKNANVNPNHDNLVIYPQEMRFLAPIAHFILLQHDFILKIDQDLILKRIHPRGVRQHCYKKKAATVGQNGRLSALCNFFSF